MKQKDNDGNYIDMRDDSTDSSATPPPHADNSNGPPPYGYHDPRPPRRRRSWVAIQILAVIAIVGCLGFIVLNISSASVETAEDTTSLNEPVSVAYEMASVSYDYGSDAIGIWSYPIAGINSINIDITIPDIVFAEGYGNNITLKLYSSSGEDYPGSFEMVTSGDVFSFNEITKNITTSIIDDYTLVVELPAQSLSSLAISSVSGDIDMTAPIDATVLNIVSVSGDVTLHEKSSSDVKVCTTSGDISLHELYTDTLLLESVTGDIFAYGGLYAQSCDISTTSGDFYGANVYVSNLQMETVTGDFDIVSGLEYTLEYSTVSGSIDDWGSTQNGEADISFSSTSGSLFIQTQ